MLLIYEIKTSWQSLNFAIENIRNNVGIVKKINIIYYEIQ